MMMMLHLKRYNAFIIEHKKLDERPEQIAILNYFGHYVCEGTGKTLANE